MVREKFQNSTELSDADQKKITVGGYGSVGDGNLILTVALGELEDIQLQNKVQQLLEPFIFDFVENLKGRLEAEYGAQGAPKTFKKLHN